MGPDARRRVRNERAILNRLSGVPGAPVMLAGSDYDVFILMEDVGGVSLATLLRDRPFPLSRIVDFAEALAMVIADVHQRGVVHKDINPTNIVVRGDPGVPLLIDFELASTLFEERPDFTPHTDIVGTLAYIAPEQTGQTGWSVDRRADLYALGATLYELVTGAPPFAEEDPLRLVHAHLTQIPTPPCEVNPEVPPALSQIIEHLLEKEPDRRYQSAEGVRNDLRLIREAPDALPGSFRPGQRDFPWRLVPPSRLIGRDRELETLDLALAGAIAGESHGLLVSGPSGVGKTALIDELRPRVAKAGGWFVSGKCDQYRRDPGADALRQALRGLVRLLLSEPEARLEPLRARVLAEFGPDAGLMAAALPELERLLEVAPETPSGDPAGLAVRLRLNALRFLDVVVTADRPVVVVIDDLQWAGPTVMGFVDAVFAERRSRGTLLVCAYRDSEIDAGHPLAAALSRARRLATPPAHLRLANLAPPDLRDMIVTMLRQPAADLAALTAAVLDHTAGNPFDTVEFLNSLRRDGALRPGREGWIWDPTIVRQYPGRGDVLTLLTARIAALPEPTREALAVMACLGGAVDLAVVSAALPATTNHSGACPDPTGPLAPALESGLLVMEHGGAASVRFRHDRIQQAAYATLSERSRANIRLAVARRLAPVPGAALIAAEQFSLARDQIVDTDECRSVAALFHEAADHARILGDHAIAERYLAGAMDLSRRVEVGNAADESFRVQLAIERHAALCALARFDEADRLYATIERADIDPVRRAEAAVVRVRSLTSRVQPKEAIALGLATLAELGHQLPSAEDLPATVERGIARLRAWATNNGETAEVRRGWTDDPRASAAARIISWTITPAVLIGSPVVPWLVVEAARLWANSGAAPGLVSALVRTPVATIPTAGDYRTGYTAARRVLAVAKALGHDEPFNRFLFALIAGPWFEPLEDSVRAARGAREDMLRAGQISNASFTFYSSVCDLTECASALDELSEEVDLGISLTGRVGNDYTRAGIAPYRQAIRALRGEPDEPDGSDGAAFQSETASSANPPAALHFHTMRALTAAIFGEREALVWHAARGAELIPALIANQVTVRAHLLQALALAQLGHGSRDPELLRELDRHRSWLAERATQAPGNFLHLRLFIDAERAWTLGDFAEADEAFDAAQREVASRRRPWHRALIAERRALCYFARGMEYAGRAALREARRCYHEWGASRKVERLEQDYPFVRATGGQPAEAFRRTTSTASISSEAIDMLAVLQASQALSSERNVDQLQSQVAEILCQLTGATHAQLLVRDPDSGEWTLPRSRELPAAVSVPIGAAAGLLPLSVFRYVERTAEPLLVEDATRDDRFSSDPYLRGLAGCALLAVPILSRGEPSAMLLLENRHSRGAFGTNRLDTVLLIAGQLSVSLDNARIYGTLERKVAERTEALRAANARLERLSVTDPLTGLANRRLMDETLEQVWRRAASDSIAIAMIDIDHFKRYNDHFGHQAGDGCLRRVAEAIGSVVRSTDTAARYGGEEFILVLPGADERVAGVVAERVRAAVAALEIPHPLSAHRIVTVSIGYAATLPDPDTRVEWLIKVADSRLYEAKAGGRNRISGGRGTP